MFDLSNIPKFNKLFDKLAPDKKNNSAIMVFKSDITHLINTFTKVIKINLKEPYINVYTQALKEANSVIKKLQAKPIKIKCITKEDKETLDELQKLALKIANSIKESSIKTLATIDYLKECSELTKSYKQDKNQDKLIVKNKNLEKADLEKIKSDKIAVENTNTDKNKKLDNETKTFSRESLKKWYEHSFTLKQSADSKTQKDIREQLMPILFSKLIKIQKYQQLTQKYKGVFIQHTDQGNHPLIEAMDGHCYGSTLEWGFVLKNNPPAQAASATTHCALFCQSLDTLYQQKTLPDFFFSYALAGENNLINRRTVYNQIVCHQFEKLEKQEKSYNQVASGALIGKETFELFEVICKTSKNHKVSTIEITLGTFEKSTDPAHSVGISKIWINPKECVYRFKDINIGEFEFKSKEDLIPWLDELFILIGYPNEFHYFKLTCIDPILDSKIFNKHQPLRREHSFSLTSFKAKAKSMSNLHGLANHPDDGDESTPVLRIPTVRSLTAAALKNPPQKLSK